MRNTLFATLFAATLCAASASAQSITSSPVHDGSVWYARLGYGVIIGDATYAAPSFGLIGFRAEHGPLAADVSFFNFQSRAGSQTGPLPSETTGSFIKLEALYFLNDEAEHSLYAGGGLARGTSSIFMPSTAPGRVPDRTMYGDGLQGQLTAGYEIARTSPIRAFIQADVTLPFYNVAETSYDANGPGRATGRSRYAPAMEISFGLGWRRH